MWDMPRQSMAYLTSGPIGCSMYISKEKMIIFRYDCAIVFRRGELGLCVVFVSQSLLYCYSISRFVQGRWMLFNGKPVFAGRYWNPYINSRKSSYLYSWGCNCQRLREVKSRRPWIFWQRHTRSVAIHTPMHVSMQFIQHRTAHKAPKRLFLARQKDGKSLQRP